MRAYLRGDAVPFDDLEAYHRDGAQSIDALGLATAPPDSRLHWLDASLPPVPVEVVATGPRVLDAAARGADRVLLAVGADPARVRMGGRPGAGTNADVPIGSFVNVVVHDDPDDRPTLAAGGVATFARFSVMDGRVRTPIDADSEAVLGQVHGAYDMTMHTRSGSAQAGKLSDDFIDRFAVVGPPSTASSGSAA